jgi:hypothetical protein
LTAAAERDYGVRVLVLRAWCPELKREPGEHRQVRDCPAAVIENDLHDEHWSERPGSGGH